MYFSYSGEEYRTHETEKEARDAVEEDMAFWVNDAEYNGEWEPRSREVCYGKITHAIKCVKADIGPVDDVQAVEHHILEPVKGANDELEGDNIAAMHEIKNLHEMLRKVGQRLVDTETELKETKEHFEKFASMAATCKRENTHEWMVSMQVHLNGACDRLDPIAYVVMVGASYFELRRTERDTTTKDADDGE